MEALPRIVVVTEDEVAGFAGNGASATDETSITIPLRRLSRACGNGRMRLCLVGENVGRGRGSGFIARRLVIFASEDGDGGFKALLMADGLSGRDNLCPNVSSTCTRGDLLATCPRATADLAIGRPSGVE